MTKKYSHSFSHSHLNLHISSSSPRLTLTVTDLGGGQGLFVLSGYDLEAEHPDGSWDIQYSLDGNEPWELALTFVGGAGQLSDQVIINNPTPFYFRAVGRDASTNIVVVSNVFGPIVLVE